MSYKPSPADRAYLFNLTNREIVVRWWAAYEGRAEYPEYFELMSYGMNKYVNPKESP